MSGCSHCVVSFMGLQTEFPILVCDLATGTDAIIGTDVLSSVLPHTVQITFIFIDFRVCDFAFLAFRVLNVFYFQTDFNLRFKRKRDLRLTCKRAFDGSYIADYSLKCLCTLHRILSLKWNSPAVSETKTETETKPTQRSQITDQNLRFKRAKRAKRVSNSKPIQKSSKRV